MSTTDPVLPAPEQPSDLASHLAEGFRPTSWASAHEGAPPPVPARRKEEPHPGFLWSVVWCIGFVLFTQTPGALAAVGYVAFVAVLWPEQVPLKNLGSAKELMQTDAVSTAMLIAFACTELVVVGFSLLILRLAFGSDWKRKVGLRLPAAFHVLLCLAAFPALWLLAAGSFGLFDHLFGKPGLPELIAYPAAAVLGFGLPLGALRLLLGRDWPRALRQRATVGGYALLGVGVSLAGLLSWVAFQYLRQVLAPLQPPGQPEEMGMMEEVSKLFTRWDLSLAVLIIGLGPGVGEELWCRAFLGRGLVGRYGVVLGVILSSLFFGIIHVEPRQGTMAALMGLCLHYSYLMTRSLYVPMLLHFLNNSVSVCGSRAPLLTQIENTPGGIPVGVYLAGGVLLGVVAWALYKTRARLVAVEDGVAWQPEYPGMDYPPEGAGVRVERPFAVDAFLWVGLAFLAFLGACAWFVSQL